MPAKNHIELVTKTLAVLESLAVSEHGKALKEIAKDVGLEKSSIFRILFTLKAAGYVEQPEKNGIYRLTLKTAGLSRRNANRMGWAAVARPYLTSLRDKLDESVAIAEWRANSIILIDVIETSHPLRLNIHIGDHCPIHATAIGKAVAAFLPPQELAALLDHSKLAPYTKHTHTKLRGLKLDLARVHKTGCAFNNEETMAGAFIVGAPIFDSRSSVCGALSVNAPTSRCSGARKKHLIASVVETGKQISADLAYIGFVRWAV